MGIKANELRIGNILNFLIKNETGGSVTGRVLTKITAGQILKMSETPNVDDFWEPVLITEHTLDCAGFKKIRGGYYQNPKVLSYVTFSGPELVCCVNGNKLLEAETGHKIKYLHQLQNLYFALTNEELNINL